MISNKSSPKLFSSPKVLASPKGILKTPHIHEKDSEKENHKEHHKDQHNHHDGFSEIDVTPIKNICKGPNPVYLCQAKQDSQYLVLKFFPYQHDKPNHLYTNSLHAKDLQHPNVISMKHFHEKVSGDFINMKNQVYSVLSFEVAPYGDFQSLLNNNRIPCDDKLIRTFFHQMIDALEYMHHEGVSHLDLKLDNLLLGKDYNLKIADFDACYWLNHHHTHKIERKGTKNFRSPEIKEGKLMSPNPSDIYSAGIILFILKTRMFPYQEDHNEKMYQAMLNDPAAFWEAQSENSEHTINCDDDFKDLFISMIRPNPFRRATIAEIKKSKWYNGAIYQKNELVAVLKEKNKIPKIIPRN